jgi:hypothetical protein
MIHITTPTTYLPERRYIADIIFAEFLGMPYTLHLTDGHIGSDTQLPYSTLQIGDQTLTFPDIFFQTPESQWLQKRSLPTNPLQTWVVPNHQNISLCKKEIPIIYGTTPNDTLYDIPIDIFGSAFFMLTRYEEVAQPEIRDNHNRFPATASLAYQEGFLDRPIINEYLEILWHFIQKKAPSLKRKKRTFQIIPSHDVDSPYLYPFRNPLQIAKTCARTLLQTKNPLKSLEHIYHYTEAKFDKLTNDPHNTFDFLMKVSEENNIKSQFYFITGKTSKRNCGDYNIEHPIIQKLMQEISKRGHNIGLHPSFNTYKSGEKIKDEFQKLHGICERLSINQTKWGGRQHYLKWQAPNTWQHWEDAGLDYDSTLSFADHPGFRCGVCYDYPVFNLHTKKVLKLREYPLIVMECSIIARRYMNMGHTQKALDYMLLLKSRCKLFEGNFTILWHNSFFKYPQDKIIYKNILENQC